MATERTAKRRRSGSRTHSGSLSPALSSVSETYGRRVCSKPPSPLLNPAVHQHEELQTPIALAVSEHFSALEIHFKLDEDRKRGGVLYPRDIGNLLLWAVPSATPLIEGPRIFFLRNKSKLRDVVVIYVNGWTYEDIMSSVVSAEDQGRKHHRTEGTNERRLPEKPKRSIQAEEREADIRAKCGNSPDARASSSVHKEDGVLFRPIRTQQCWARRLGGVQCAPLRGSDRRRPLPMEIFWRTGDSSAAAAAAAAAAPVAPQPCGVGALFGRALALHNGAPESATTEPAPPSPEKEKGGGEGERSGDEALWGDRDVLTSYALTLDAHGAMLEELAYTCALPHGEDANEWTAFDPPAAPSDKPNVFALDCEMVLVENRVSALARVTLVNVLCDEVVLDTLVRPSLPVVNYLTRYSGVDAEMLDDVKTTLADCQRELKRYIDTDTFVVGHSLENDFKACKLLPNCRVLDSAHLFPHPSGLPFKNALRFLAMRYLRRKIQQGAHDSAVDARTSADLVLLKLRHGPSFGVRARVSVLQQIRDAGTATAGIEMHLFDDACALRDIVGDIDTRHSPHAVLHTVSVRHDDDAVRKAVKSLQQRPASPAAFALTWVKLNKGNNMNGNTDDATDEVEGTNRRVMRIVRAAPQNSLVLVLAGRDDADDNGRPEGRSVCFAYVKDEREVGPPDAWLEASAGNGTETKSAVADTPPACKQQ